MQRHPSQLMVCHEHVDERAASSVHPETYAFCDLKAHGWCIDCGYNVCEIHIQARHERHRIQLVSDESEAVEAAKERRSGRERRQ